MSSQRTEVIYGLHAVRALLKRHPERVTRVYLQQGRHDERADEIEQLARAAGREVTRVDAKQLQARLGKSPPPSIISDLIVKALKVRRPATRYHGGGSPAPCCSCAVCLRTVCWTL